MDEKIADKDYFFDAEGNVTTDESKGVRWLARKGANVLPEHREALEGFSGGKAEEAEPGNDAESDGSDDGEKASSPKLNKSATPKKNKGAKK